jgi:hypothetical protein
MVQTNCSTLTRNPCPCLASAKQWFLKEQNKSIVGEYWGRLVCITIDCHRKLHSHAETHTRARSTEAKVPGYRPPEAEARHGVERGRRGRRELGKIVVDIRAARIRAAAAADLVFLLAGYSRVGRGFIVCGSGSVVAAAAAAAARDDRAVRANRVDLHSERTAQHWFGRQFDVRQTRHLRHGHGRAPIARERRGRGRRRQQRGVHAGVSRATAIAIVRAECHARTATARRVLRANRRRVMVGDGERGLGLERRRGGHLGARHVLAASGGCRGGSQLEGAKREGESE